MQKEQKSSNRILFIDALKGFAILCVVLGHIGNGHMWDTGANPVFFVIYNIVNAFHMPLFIMLSGYVFRKSCITETEIQKGKVARQMLNLTILYFLWSVLLGVFKIFFGGFVNNPVTWVTLCLIPVLPLQLYWYLFVLIVFYLIFGLGGAAKVNPRLMLAITFCLALGSTWIPQNLIFDVKRVLYYSFFFFLGISLDFFIRTFREKIPGAVCLCLKIAAPSAAVILGIVFWSRTVFLHDRPLVNLLIGLGISLGLWFCFKKWKSAGNNRFLVYLGEHCLEIYLLHTFFLSAFRVLLEKLHIQNALPVILIEFAAGTFLPLLIAFLCRKLRIYNFFFAPCRYWKIK